MKALRSESTCIMNTTNKKNNKRTDDVSMLYLINKMHSILVDFIKIKLSEARNLNGLSVHPVEHFWILGVESTPHLKSTCKSPQ
ncbi:hypothetical protein T4C_5951 [Trichinella pseudospiralis]|uniref:Uncharacterized protein n=1 Tax=Trichinella pseudospiralis TaxID=6337 RepID=A0A0V1KC88_TRIPS|nr:hypothetical protein T4C_5951 [Trichinella pseudospiralis]